MTSISRWAMLALATSVSQAALAKTAAAPGSVAMEAGQSTDKAAPSTEAGSTAESGGLKDIIVTAQRRQQRLQDAPLAVSAFSDDALRTLNVQSPLDVARYVPNLIAGHNILISSANTYALRGLQNTESIATFDPAVGTYVDEIYISRQNVNDFGLFDVDRIEVLRGPQGTLFGRNTTGGAVAITLKRPTDRFGAFIEGAYGAFNRLSARGSINLPLSNNIFAKIDAYGFGDEGYVRNTQSGERFNRQNGAGVRAALLFNISPDVSWYLSGDAIQSSGDYVFNFRVGDERVFDAGIRRGDNFAGLVTGQKQFTQPGAFNDAQSATSNLEIRAGGVTINAITGVRFTQQTFNVEAQDSAARFGGFTLVNRSTNFQGSQELKANGKLFDNVLDLTGGVYLFYEKTRTDFADILSGNLARTQPTVPGRVLADRLLTNDTVAIAGYLQGDINVTSKLIATLGGRYTYEEKTVGVESNRNPLVPVANDITTAGLTAAGTPTRLGTSQFTPRFVLTYKLNDDVSVYGSATKGFKSGGWNARSTNAAAFTSFDPETTWSYELGLRSELFNRKLRFNLTAFQAFTDNLQQSASFRLPSGSSTFVTRNVGTLDARGFELETVFTPINNLNFFANAAYLDAEFNRLRPELLTQQAGCRAALAAGTATTGLCGASIITATGAIALPARAPQWNGSFGANYKIEMKNGWSLTPAFDTSWTTSYETGTANLRQVFKTVAGSEEQGYFLLNGSVRIATPDDHLSVMVSCRNCADQDYIISANPPQYFYADPRRWEIRLRYRY